MKRRRYYVPDPSDGLLLRARNLLVGKKVLPFPGSIALETISGCNARCVFCAQHEATRGVPKGRMSSALFERIVEECARHADVLERVSFAFDNEPLLDRELLAKVAHVKTRLPFATTNVTTNGILLTPEVVRALYASGAVDEINVSVQSIERGTYERLTGVKTYDAVMANLEALADIHRAHRGHRPVVEINTCLTPETVAERPAAEARWRGMGFRTHHIPLDNRAPGAPATGVPYHRYCRRPFHTMVICWDGVVPVCCADYRRSCVVGDVTRAGVAAVWNGAEMSAVRRELVSGRFEKALLCQGCWMSDEG